MGGVALVLGAFFLAVLTRNSLKMYDYIGQTAESKHEIYITGEGKVTVKPDIAKISLGLTTKAQTVAEAQKQNTETMNTLTKTLKDEFKIKNEDIQTSNYSIYPDYVWFNNKQNLNGYVVSQNLDVKIRDLDKAGDVLARAGEAGLNQVGGLQFSVDDPEKSRIEARDKAIENAKEKAEALARVAGVKLGRVISVSESGDQPQPPIYGMGAGMMYAKSDVSQSPSIEVGTNEIKVTVTIGYEIL